MTTVVLVAQHFVDLVVSAAVFYVVHLVYGPWTTTLRVLGHGLSLFVLSRTSAADPECFQADLLALT